MRIPVKLIKRLGILAILVMCLGFVLSTSKMQNVLAAPCCSDCLPDYDNCVAGCEPGAAGSSCRNMCNNMRESCHHNCDMSCGGGSTGGACNNDFDCPIGCSCEMSQQHSMEYELLEQQKNSYCSDCAIIGDSWSCSRCSYYTYLYENYRESHPDICSCP